jgi:hypothetical protein
MNNYIYVFLVSMVPLIELRGAIPFAYVFKAADPSFNLLWAYILSAAELCRVNPTCFTGAS